MKYEFRLQSRVDAPAKVVFDWHLRPGALERLMPGFQPLEVLERHGNVETNGRVITKMRIGPFAMKWISQHKDFNRAQLSFVDETKGGPFQWEHYHSVLPDNSGACVLSDHLRYQLPFGLGPIINFKMRADLDRAFRYRHQILKSDVRRHCEYPNESLRIGITGANGLVGSSLAAFLTTGGHTVIPITRPGRQKYNYLSERIEWDPKAGKIESTKLEGFDAIIHLAGENIASRRWSTKQKEEIRRSRVEGTRFLTSEIIKLKNPPRVFVSASAIGIYANRGDEILTETSAPGLDFLSKVCQEWEAAAQPARDRGVRTVNLRFGVILAARDGALKKMLIPFLLGAGGRVGSGDQWMSWISLYDAVAAIHYAIMNDQISGAANAVAPGAVTNSEFTKTLGRVLRRPTIAPLPAPIVSLAFGELGETLLLGSQRVIPEVLQNARFRFEYPNLEDALRFELGRY
ncbi:MAG: TIGR01777 family oxidoreductase [Planctomycetota bacterium]